MITDIREYGEGMDVEVIFREPEKGGCSVPEIKPPGRWVIVAKNEGGFSGTEVDLEDVINWVKQNQAAMEGLEE